jgi:hypothetical protein
VREEQRNKLEQMASLENRSVSNLIEVMANERWDRLAEQQGIERVRVKFSRSLSGIGSVRHWKNALAVLAALSASIALAEDFKTLDGKEYKNATVKRVETDGLVLSSKSRISKVYFTELPKGVQQRFNYDPEKAAGYSAQQECGK